MMNTECLCNEQLKNTDDYNINNHIYIVYTYRNRLLPNNNSLHDNTISKHFTNKRSIIIIHLQMITYLIINALSIFSIIQFSSPCRKNIKQDKKEQYQFVRAKYFLNQRAILFKMTITLFAARCEICNQLIARTRFIINARNGFYISEGEGEPASSLKHRLV